MRGDVEKFDNYYFMTFLDKSSSNVETFFCKMKYTILVVLRLKLVHGQLKNEMLVFKILVYLLKEYVQIYFRALV